MEKKRIRVLMKVSITSKKLEAKMIELKQNSRGDHLRLDKNIPTKFLMTNLQTVLMVTTKTCLHVYPKMYIIIYLEINADTTVSIHHSSL